MKSMVIVSFVVGLACSRGLMGAKADAQSCTKYADKLCAEVGPDSPRCQTIKQTLEILPATACAAGLADVAYSKGKLAEAGKKCDELVSKLCKDLGEQTETCGMAKSRIKSMPPDRCDTMLQHYAEVLRDLQRMEAANKPLSPEQAAAIAGGDAPSFGPKGAKVTIVEFSDFQCPYCSKAADVVHQLRKKYSDKVRFVFRQFPLSFHPNAQVAAEAALAANAQSKFWEMHDQMFKEQSKLDRASLEAAAKKVGLNIAAFKGALDEKKFATAVAADLKLGETAAVNGTPTMFINGQRVANPTDFEALSKQIDAALSGS